MCKPIGASVLPATSPKPGEGFEGDGRSLAGTRSQSTKRVSHASRQGKVPVPAGDIVFPQGAQNETYPPIWKRSQTVLPHSSTWTMKRAP